MPSSLKPQTVPIAGLGEMSGAEWPGAPSMEMETILRTPRGELPDVPPPAASSYPSFWRQLFPIPGEMPLSHQSGDPAQGVSLGHFTIEKRIGSGAMGAVFLAFDDRLHRQVALKILAPAQAADPNTVQRFQNEAQAAARLDHDHVARVFYYGEERGLHFIAYEYVAGVNLRDLLRQRGRLSPSEAVNYAIQIATALRHTSRHGVIHRDIKPSNIIVTASGRAKLVDLGLAKRAGQDPDGELTVAGTTLGTFDYISPEQARDPRSVDVRSDIYSLGCTLYHLLTGEPPYPEGTVLQKLLDHQAHETPDVSTKNRRISPAFSAVIRKMMSSDVKRRYANPEELLRDLAVVARTLGLRVVSSDSAAVVPEARLQGSWWDRNFGWVLTAVALLLIVAGLQAAPELLDRISNWSTKVGSTTQNPADVAPAGSLPSSPTSADAADPATPNIGRIAEDDPRYSHRPPATLASKADELPAVTPKPSSDAGESVTSAAVVEKPTVPPTTTAPPEEKSPAITIIGAKTAFTSLEQACSEAKDGEIIELRYDGARAQSEHTIRLTNKRLVIRAAKGFRPRLDFNDEGRSGEQPVNRIIGVSGGSLQLHDVDLVAAVGSSPTGAPWSLFSLDRPEQLKLDGVTITVVNPKRRAASVMELGAAATSGSGMMKTGLPASPPEIQLSGCVIRGGASLLTVRDAVPARCSVDDCVLALDDTLLQVLARSMMNAADNGRLKLELSHTTALLGGSLVLTRQEDNIDESQLPLVVVAQNNLISVGREHPLIDLSGSDAMELRDSFAWSGERNFYNDIKSFLVIRSRQNTSPSTFDFPAWREFWGSDISGSSNTSIRWLGDIRTLPLQDLALEDVSLVTSGGVNPAIKAAADGTDLGALLEKLPTPPKVDAGE